MVPTWGMAGAAPQHVSSPQQWHDVADIMHTRHDGFNAAHLVSKRRSHGSMTLLPQNATHKQIPCLAAQRTMGTPAHLKVGIKPVQERDPMVHITLR